MDNANNFKLAGIEYLGQEGLSYSCKEAVIRFLQFGDKVSRARVLSSSGTHCLLLTINGGDLVAIKSGFASGYEGTGAYVFSYVLALLDAHHITIEEYDVAPDVIERIDNSALTVLDLESLDTSLPIRPNRWYEYIFSQHLQYKSGKMSLWEDFPLVIPFATIDYRLVDLALSFWENPDNNLLIGYRRLEDIVRQRTGIDESSTKLFSKAFTSPESPLFWKDIEQGEQSGRAQLFTAAFLAYRNPRAHREEKGDARNQLVEFLLLNHLYCLEKSACDRNSVPS